MCIFVLGTNKLLKFKLDFNSGENYTFCIYFELIFGENFRIYYVYKPIIILSLLLAEIYTLLRISYNYIHTIKHVN